MVLMVPGDPWWFLAVPGRSGSSRVVQYSVIAQKSLCNKAWPVVILI